MLRGRQPAKRWLSWGAGGSEGGEEVRRIVGFLVRAREVNGWTLVEVEGGARWISSLRPICATRFKH